MAENSCVVCFKNCHVYSIGECDHPVCYECSTRMRVICLQNECPMCRQEMEMVVFTERIRPFRRLKRSYAIYDNVYHIAFETRDIKDYFVKLLSFFCKECSKRPTFESFESLNEHMTIIHDKYCCDLCADNLKLFPVERRYYSRKDLNRHYIKGDIDDRSHRGHPLCEFCDVRYLDRDELYRHLRKDHFYCHICDSEGVQQFYGVYNTLRDHYRSDHFLCEEGECAKEQLTSVFPTDVELKIHKALVHNKNPRQRSRHVELEFSLPARGFRERRQDGGHLAVDENSATPCSSSPPPILLDEAFPSLTNNNTTYIAPRTKYQASSSNRRLAFDERNFPALATELAPLSATSTSKSLATPTKKSNKKINNEAQTNKSSCSSTWVKKTKEKKIADNKSTQISIPSSRKPPTLNCENFPDLQSDGIPPSNNNTKTKKSAKKSISATSQGGDNKQSRLNYSEMIIKSNVKASNCKKQDQKKGSAAAGKNKSSGSKQADESAEDNGCSSFGKNINFLLSANRKKVKMKNEHDTDVLIPLNTYNKNRKLEEKLASDSTSTESPTKLTSSNRRRNSETNCDNGGRAEKKNKEKISPNSSDKENVKLNPAVCTAKMIEKQMISKNEIGKSEERENTDNVKEKIRNQNYELTETRSDRVLKPPPGLGTGIARFPPGLARQIREGTSTCDSKILPAAFQYLQPIEYVPRNTKLFENIAKSMKRQDSNVLKDFKSTSSLFRDGFISAFDYYMFCLENIESDRFLDILVDLVALLPDIVKQQELWNAHQSVMPSALQNSLLESCQLCYQILKLDDISYHYSNHANDYAVTDAIPPP